MKKVYCNTEIEEIEKKISNHDMNHGYLENVLGFLDIHALIYTLEERFVAAATVEGL